MANPARSATWASATSNILETGVSTRVQARGSVSANRAASSYASMPPMSSTIRLRLLRLSRQAHSASARTKSESARSRANSALTSKGGGFMISRRDFLAAIAAAAAGGGAGAQAAAAAVPSLKDACKDIFLIGTALDFRTPDELTPVELDLIKAQFNVITPENS